MATIPGRIFDQSAAVARGLLDAWSTNVASLFKLADIGCTMVLEQTSRCDSFWAMPGDAVKEKPRTRDRDVTLEPASRMETQMYNLLKAKEEIDAVAKHATDLATHVIAKSDALDAKLESFKTEILHTIETKFAELERKIIGGDDHSLETSAVADLGAKVSLLIHGPAEPPPHVEGGHDHGYQDHDHQNQGHSDHDHGHGDQGHHDGWHQNDHH